MDTTVYSKYCKGVGFCHFIQLPRVHRISMGAIFLLCKHNCAGPFYFSRLNYLNLWHFVSLRFFKHFCILSCLIQGTGFHFPGVNSIKSLVILVPPKFLSQIVLNYFIIFSFLSRYPLVCRRSEFLVVIRASFFSHVLWLFVDVVEITPIAPLIFCSAPWSFLF